MANFIPSLSKVRYLLSLRASASAFAPSSPIYVATKFKMEE